MDVVLHGDPTESHGQDAGEVEGLGRQVREVGRDNHEKGLDGADVVGEPEREAFPLTSGRMPRGDDSIVLLFRPAFQFIFGPFFEFAQIAGEPGSDSLKNSQLFMTERGPYT